MDFVRSLISFQLTNFVLYNKIVSSFANVDNKNASIIAHGFVFERWN